MNKLYMLGTGTPTPTPERFGTSFVLQLGDEYIMIDCGHATTYKLVRAGLKPTQIDHLFFTHHHSDHNADYPGFLMCRFDQSTGNETVLHVRGPAPTALMTERLYGQRGVFNDDWRARTGDPVSQAVHKNRGGTLPRPIPVIKVEDIVAGPVIETDAWALTAIEVHHTQPFLQSLAYRFDTPHGSICFAGDTDSVQIIAGFAKGCDVLVANCWDLQSTMDQNGEWKGQTGTRDTGNMAAGAGVKTVVMTHTGPALAAAKDQGIAEVAALFDGKIIFAEELMTIDLF